MEAWHSSSSWCWWWFKCEPAHHFETYLTWQLLSLRCYCYHLPQVIKHSLDWAPQHNTNSCNINLNLSLLLLFLSDLLPSISVPFSFSSVSTPISPQVNIITHNERKRKTNKKDKNCSKIKPWKVLCFAFIDSKVALIWLLKFSNGSFCLHPLFFFLEIQTVRAFFSLVFFYVSMVQVQSLNLLLNWIH